MLDLKNAFEIKRSATQNAHIYIEKLLLKSTQGNWKPKICNR